MVNPFTFRKYNLNYRRIRIMLSLNEDDFKDKLSLDDNDLDALSVETITL